MKDISVFMDKASVPNQQELKAHLRESSALWEEIEDYVMKQYPKGLAEWNYPGKKYGWSYRIKDKRRAIIYFLPRAGYFKIAFVFGQKAYDAIMRSPIVEEIKIELQGAKKYAEGRGIRIEVQNEAILEDIKNLVDIKMVF